MQTITFKPNNVCSREMTIEVDDNGVITRAQVIGGCNGNLKAIAKLCDGMQASEIIAKLKGNTCGFKSTSCADQFTKALES